MRTIQFTGDILKPYLKTRNNYDWDAAADGDHVLCLIAGVAERRDAKRGYKIAEKRRLGNLGKPAIFQTAFFGLTCAQKRNAMR